MPAPLVVVPADVVQLAQRLADSVDAAARQVPRNAVVDPAGQDSISLLGAQRLNRRGAQLPIRILRGLADSRAAAHVIGDTGARYGKKDNENAGKLGGRGGDDVRNRTTDSSGYGTIYFPEDPPSLVPSSTDALIFAQELESGPQTGPAAHFAEQFRGYRINTHPTLADAVHRARDALRGWKPVGEQRVAPLFDKYSTWLTQVDSQLLNLEQQTESYVRAFETVRRRHPTAARIRDVRSEYSAAADAYQQNPTPENKARYDRAVAEYKRTEEQAASARTQYQNDVEQGVSAAEVDSELPPAPQLLSGTSAAVGSGTSAGVKPKSTLDKILSAVNTGKGIADAITAVKALETAVSGAGGGNPGGLGAANLSAGGTTDPGAAATNPVSGTDPSTTGTGGSTTGAGTGTGSGSDSSGGGTDPNALSNLLKNQSNAPGQQGNNDQNLPPSDTPATDFPPADYPSFMPGGGDPGANSPAAPGNPVPVAVNAPLGAPNSPRTTTRNPVTQATVFPPAVTVGGTGQGSGMPYLPLSPGNPNAGGKDRNRKPELEPDAVVFVDDTLYSELVVGEKPVIPPTVTTPAPAASSSEAVNQTGGNT